MSHLTPLLAHAGEGATWQALVVVFSLGLVVVAVLGIVGLVRLDSADDLVLPIASVAIASSLAPLGSGWLSDWVGWAFPAGVVALVTILLAALTRLDLSLSSPFTYGAVAIAVIGAVGLHQPITLAWHPPPEFLPLADDVEVAFASPSDGSEVDAGTVDVTVAVTGGSITSELVATDRIGPDPEEAGVIAVAVDGSPVTVTYEQTCTLEAPCDEVTFPLELEPGDRTLTVEFRRADGVPFTPLVTDRIEVRAG